VSIDLRQEVVGLLFDGGDGVGTGDRAPPGQRRRRRPGARDAGYTVTTASVDIASRPSIQALVETATDLGDVTGVIHAAGS